MDAPKKIIIAVVIVLALLPVIAKLWPKPLTIDRILEGFKKNGFSVDNVKVAQSPGLEAVAQASMTVNGATVNIYLYNDEGKIAKQLEYQRPDSGSAIVEAWNLSESLGATKPPPHITSAARRGMFMLTVTSPDLYLREQIVNAFKSL